MSSGEASKCTKCGATVPPRADFCPKCLSAVSRATGGTSVELPPDEPVAAPVRTNVPPPSAEPKPKPRSDDLLSFSPDEIDGTMMLGLCAGELAAGVVFGVPAFHAQLHDEYGWLIIVAAAAAIVLLGAILALRARHYAEEDVSLREKTKMTANIAGARGGVAQRANVYPPRTMIIAAIVVFALGALFGATVHVDS